MRVKICGLRTREEVAVAARAGASYVGFVFHARSPRNVTLGDARWIAGELPEGLSKVALTVDADDAALEQIIAAIPLDMLQLHGSETPQRVEEIRKRFRLPVMKAVGIASEADLEMLDLYARVSDQILVDAKPAPGGDLPGGNGIAFDWRLIEGRRWRHQPWMLAGGLTPQNVAEAIRLTGAPQVDVSSGVEREPGYKDPAKIAAFVAAAKGAGR